MFLPVSLSEKWAKQKKKTAVKRQGKKKKVSAVSGMNIYAFIQMTYIYLYAGRKMNKSLM